MKKAIFTLGLFSMMMVLTSFTSKVSHSSYQYVNESYDHRGRGADISIGKKLDFDVSVTIIEGSINDGLDHSNTRGGGSSITNGKKLD